MNFIIVGAGLSGLLVAEWIQRELMGTDKCGSVTVLESRDRVGGRTVSTAAHAAAKEEGEDWHGAVSLGAAWAWPDSHPKVMALAERLGVPWRTDEDDVDRVRFRSGAFALSRELARRIGPDRILLRKSVQSIEETDENDVRVTVADGSVYRADVVVLAVPPGQLMKIFPKVHGGHLIQRQPTWMSGIAKVIFFFAGQPPFWAASGLPRITRRGPIVQLYDSSPFDRSGAALGAFVPFYGVNDEQTLASHALAHLKQLFLPVPMPEPETVQVKIWWKDRETSIHSDEPARIDYTHPRPLHGVPIKQSNHVFLAGTELAPRNPGMLEGAVESFEQVQKEINKILN